MLKVGKMNLGDYERWTWTQNWWVEQPKLNSLTASDDRKPFEQPDPFSFSLTHTYTHALSLSLSLWCSTSHVICLGSAFLLSFKGPTKMVEQPSRKWNELELKKKPPTTTVRGSRVLGSGVEWSSTFSINHSTSPAWTMKPLFARSECNSEKCSR
jgi:hypothetical protein